MSVVSLSEEQKKQYHLEGFTVIKSVYTLKAVNEMKKHYYSIWLDQIVKGRIQLDSVKSLESLFAPIQEANRSYPSVKEFMLNPHNLKIAEEVLGEEALVVGTACFFKAPTTKSLTLHQDNYEIGAIGGGTCAVWTSLEQASKDNGALCVIPGSHRYGLYTKENRPDYLRHCFAIDLEKNLTAQIKVIETDPGDVIVFDGDLVHGSLANHTESHFRYSFATHFISRGTTKVYSHFNHLINRFGDVESKPLNRSHLRLIF